MPVALDYDPFAPSNLNYLRSIPEFRGLSEEEIKDLSKVILRRLYYDGEYVFKEGEEGTFIFLIEDGMCTVELVGGRIIKHLRSQDLFGEIAMIGDVKRSASVRSRGKTIIVGFKASYLDDPEKIKPQTAVKIYKELARKITKYVRDDELFYSDMDVLLFQDGGCAPGYNSVTGYITRFLEHDGRRVFVAKEGFRSMVSGTIEDYKYLVNDRFLYSQMEHITGVEFAPLLREARGANFRSERYKDFINEEIQKKAAQSIIERKVKVLIAVGGDGTLKGLKAMCRFLPDSIQVFFIPVTIDSDIFGTECIGEHTGVQIGSEKIRSYMADARSHHRMYIIEMMGRDGGYHALRSCLGAGADLAVLPNFDYDIAKIAKALQRKQSSVIVVAEGYKREARAEAKFTGNAADWFLKELVEAGLDTKMRPITEGFSRDIRGAAPNYNDITLSQQMSRLLAEGVEKGLTHVMPAVLGGREYYIPFDEIRTDNTVSERMAALANRLLD
jgi:6-phosphofructokinase 1